MHGDQQRRRLSGLDSPRRAHGRRLDGVRLGDGPLPAERGGPFRLTVAAGATLCWNVKDVGELHFSTERLPDSVPERPSH